MRLFQAGTGFLIGILLARLLGTEGLGLFAEAQAWIMLLVAFSHAGLSPLLVREAAALSHKNNPALIRGLFRLAFATLGAVTALFCAGIGLTLWQGVIAEPLRPLFLIGLPVLLLSATSFLLEAATRGLGHTILGQLPQLVIRPAVQVLCLLAVWALARPGALPPAWAMATLLAAAAAAFVAALAGFWRSSRHLTHTAPAYEARHWAGAALPLTLMNWLGAFSAQIGFIALGFWSDSVEVAEFRVGALVATLAMLGYSAVLVHNSPRFAALMAAGDKAALQSQASRASGLGTLLSAGPVLAMVFLGGEILALLFGEPYRIGAATLALLGVQVMASAVFGVAISVLVAASMGRVIVITQLCGQVLHVGLMALLIPQQGAFGAALALMASTLAVHVSLTIIAWRRLGILALPVRT